MPIRLRARPRADQLRHQLSSLAGLPEQSARTLDRWLDALQALTPEQWARVARDSSSIGWDDEMQAALVAAIERNGLEVVAWFVRDAVETTLHYALRGVARTPVVQANEFTRIQRAAEGAALAIATEAWLDRSVRDALTAPFDVILPSVFPRLLSRRRATDRLPRQAQSRR